MDTGSVFYEIIDAKELAKRWNLPTSWIYNATRARAVDAIPYLKLGKYRYQWGHPDLVRWLERHKNTQTSPREAGRK